MTVQPSIGPPTDLVVVGAGRAGRAVAAAAARLGLRVLIVTKHNPVTPRPAPFSAEPSEVGPACRVLDEHMVIDIVQDDRGRVAGVEVLDTLDTTAGTARRSVLPAAAVLLATGGSGRLFPATVQPTSATGDGIAIALRAGAAVADLEFVAFEPAVLPDLPAGRAVSVVPAMAAGAALTDRHGRRAPLATSSAAAVDRAVRHLVRSGPESLLLDACDVAGSSAAFPELHALCRDLGLEPGHDLIPLGIAAAATHGGVLADPDGRTTVPGLYAAGAVTRVSVPLTVPRTATGRDTDVVKAARAARAVAQDLTAAAGAAGGTPTTPGWPVGTRVVRPLIHAAMVTGAGPLRDARSLAAAIVGLDTAAVLHRPRTRLEAEDTTLTLLAAATLAAAAARTETRGCHHRVDYPNADELGQRGSTVITLDPAGRPVLDLRVVVDGRAGRRPTAVA